MSYNMLDIHSKALQSANPMYHEFLLKFNKKIKCLYGFIEGAEDLSYYRGFIEAAIPSDWKIDLVVVGNKDKVLGLYECFDWGQFPIKQIVFFIDRDLSDFLDPIVVNENLYITDGYSIENAIVNRNTFDRVLTEVCKIINLPSSEKEEILNLFDSQITNFSCMMQPVMAWITFWRQQGMDPYLDNIKLSRIFTFTNGRIHHQKNGCMIITIHDQCKLPLIAPQSLSEISKKMKTLSPSSNIVRGKYILWFLIEFSLHIYNNIQNFSQKYLASPKMHINFSLSTGVDIVAPRTKIPPSLNSFLSSTLLAHTNQ